MYSQLTFLYNFFSYYITAQTKHDVHSPFVFDLLTNVIQGKTANPNQQSIEKLRHKLIKDKTLIDFTDYGAGSVNPGNKTRSISQIAATSAKSVKYASLLFRLCSFLKPKTVVELGTSLGISTAYIASSSPQKLYTIEGCSPVSELAQKNLSQMGLSNIEFIKGDFAIALPKLLQEIPSVDVAFIDGNHRYEPTLSYFKMLLEKCNDNSCLVFDDINWSDEMKTSWKEICNHPKVTVSIDLFMMGIVFLNPNLSKQHFILRY